LGLSPVEQRYLDLVAGRLEAGGFELSRDVASGDREFALVARRRRVEPGKMGIADTTLVFQTLRAVGQGALKDFSAAAFRLASRLGSGGPPRGLGKAVICYAVAVTEQIDDATIAGVRAQAPVKHWAANELPVVVDLSSNTLHYFQRTPMWGAAYYRGFRKTIERYLSPGDPA
jgi:hypothetical protein